MSAERATFHQNPRIRIGIVGLGKIAHDQHLPSIMQNERFEIAFLADKSVRSSVEAPHFNSLEAVLDAGISFDAVSVCTSPQPRLELCQRLLPLQCFLLLEKPSAASFEDALRIQQNATYHNSHIFAAWHSRFAPQIGRAKDWTNKHRIIRGKVIWRENASKWHPGQDWLWRRGGFGVFDPGMNALSILTYILPGRAFSVCHGILKTPINSETPTVAKFLLNSRQTEIHCEFEFHDQDDDVWEIQLEGLDGSTMTISEGGASISIDGSAFERNDSREYQQIYEHFSRLISNRQSDFDIEPLRIIDSVFSKCRRELIGPLDEHLIRPPSK